jgi:short-subunit dehydrogenase
MASRGAKNLILLSRTGATRESAVELVADLESNQVNVATPPCDVTNAETLRSVLNDCLTHMPPIKGCIQGSMVLKVHDLFSFVSVTNHNRMPRSKI